MSDLISRQAAIHMLTNIDISGGSICEAKIGLGDIPAANDWIPVSERLPENDRFIMVSFYNSSLPDIGRYEGDADGGGAFYPGDDDKSYVHYGLFVNAWMPLPKPYMCEEGD